MVSDKRAAVKSFLTEVKHVIRAGSRTSPRWSLSTARQKNLDTIGELGMTLADVESEILGLSVDDFCEGPLKDRQMPGDLWVFGKMISGREVYVKLKLSSDERRPNVYVISFHFAGSPMRYFFRK